MLIEMKISTQKFKWHYESYTKIYTGLFRLPLTYSSFLRLEPLKHNSTNWTDILYKINLDKNL